MLLLSGGLGGYDRVGWVFIRNRRRSRRRLRNEMYTKIESLTHHLL